MAKVLTAKALENAKPGAARREIPDGYLPGLYFVLQPSGAASWAVRYRYGGRPRKLTLGPYPALKLPDARARGADALKAVADGRDPASEKKDRKRVAREGPDHSDLVPAVIDLFIARYARPKNRSADEVERLLKRELARWASRRVQDITKRDVIEILDGVTDRGAPYLANRLFANMRKMFAWCVERGILTTSPMAGVKAPAAEVSRDRILTDAEVRWFWAATEELDYPFGPMFRLLLVTAQRREEVAGMRRQELDLVDRSWTIPRERAKNDKAHEVPLAKQALAIIDAIPPLTANRDFLFSTTGRTPASGYSNAKERVEARMLVLAKQGAAERGDDPDEVNIARWTLHDLRRTAASGMARLGQPVHVVEAVLNHRSGAIRGVAAVYNRYSYADEKRRALEAWGGFVERLVSAEPASNVVALRG